MNLKSSWSQNSLVNEVFAISHPNHENVVQSLNSVDVCEKLVDDLVPNLRSCVCMETSLLADRINFIKYDNMQWAFVAKFLLVSSCLSKKFSYVFFRLANITTKNLGAINNFQVFDIECFGELSRD